ncbi:MAG TPA: single-stranded-DNA-specific exonuclease RecJ [Cyanothece sp. UBA12306]|nr:single-stranded-DNA-specific exonuclease RecJ [Cyanothece sp. UBA12306]
MNSLQSRWHIVPSPSVPLWFLEIVKNYTCGSNGEYAAQLLWQRGIQDKDQLIAFLDANAYHPTSPFAFGQEIKWAVSRLKNAYEKQEKVTIWGDFDADGITATSVLWEGLGQFFIPHLQLNYYIPNRLKESHGLNCQGIDKLFASGTNLIVTCDTGSTNLAEIDYANQLGIDIIITDHHTLPDDRPPVISIINPRYFSDNHPLFNLSGVAVAYKLVEAFYQTLPEIPSQPLEELLDLVAIGLIADLVELKGDCRYLAQKGIEQLKKNRQFSIRSGIAQLLAYCKKSGDRPTDISYGIGPRINAISRIHGDANFGVELLTSRDQERCQKLALDTELANTRRREIQQRVIKDAKNKLDQIDLSTTGFIVLEDPQWPNGVLGLVAGQIAQEYGRPTILLTTAETENLGENDIKLARGSARSINQIDLYELVASQKHLLHRFGGHPFAAGLSLDVKNIPLFKESINQILRQKINDISLSQTMIEVDLVVKVADLGQSLFRELKLLEPCGMGNKVPKLLIKNCWFDKIWNNNSKDLRGNKIKSIRTTFEIYDEYSDQGFPGIWWDHYQEDLPQKQPQDVIVELDYNSYNERYEVRLIDIRKHGLDVAINSENSNYPTLLDGRDQENLKQINSNYKILQNCPKTWEELQQIYRKNQQEQTKLVLAYSCRNQLNSSQIWHKLVGIAKYLSRTQEKVTRQQLTEKLDISDRILNLGLETLSNLGFTLYQEQEQLQFQWGGEISDDIQLQINYFLEAIEEEEFQRQYFYKVPLNIIEQRLRNY